jgi:hypothetical protein
MSQGSRCTRDWSVCGSLQLVHRDGLGGLDLLGGAVAHEDGLAAPHDGDGLADGDRVMSTSVLASASTSLPGSWSG